MHRLIRTNPVGELVRYEYWLDKRLLEKPDLRDVATSVVWKQFDEALQAGGRRLTRKQTTLC
jgi:hypothetical protein